MRKCASGEHINHISIRELNHEIQIRGVYNGPSAAGILHSQHAWAFLSVFDLSSFATAELGRHDVQHGHEKQNDLSMNVDKSCMRSIMIMKCRIKRLV